VPKEAIVMKILHPFIWLALSAPVLAVACSSSSDDVASGANAVGASKPKPGTPATGGGAANGASTTSNGFEVIFLGSQSNADGTSTWRYRVSETPCAQDLSNWVLEVFDCPVVSATPEPNEFVHPDPNANLTGVKWETGDKFASAEFAVTVSGAARAATVRFAVKGPDVELGETTGPRCGDASVPPTNPKTRGTGKGRCADASVPPTVDATPPPPPPSIPDAGSDACASGISCSEESPCPERFGCYSNCCIPLLR
jgi:hypothetical protein